jgi:aarF domain-containing kinase
MMLATSTRMSQWTVQKLSHTGQKVLEAAPNHVVPLPAWTFATRRFQHSLPYHYQQLSIQRQYQQLSQTNQQQLPQFSPITVKRWKQNFSRLYARRILEIAAASAASQRFVSELEGAIDRPTNWQDWERKDWTDELLSSIGTNSVERVWSACVRVAALTTLAAPMAVLVPASYVSDRAHKWSWAYALWGIEQAGPTFLKLVQWATTRQDLFSPQFCQYFGKLRDDTVGHQWKDTVKILEEDLGAAAVAMLDLRPDPIGSGCIAQVYRGTLKEAAGQYPKGTDVAVKVQHPGIWHKVCVDFYILGKSAKFLEDLPYLNLGYLALADTVRQFRDMMLPQLDLTLEAKHLTRFNRDFSNDETISFPHPLNGLTTPRVLTETYVDGTPIMEYLTAPKEVRKELAVMGLDATLKMIFLNDFLHGDLHPGNILVGEIPGKPGKLQLHLLDCGLVVEMGPQQVRFE